MQQARRHLPGAGPGAAHRHRARQKAWRNLRFPLAWAPPEANVARIVADDPNLSSDDQWFAFTPPRVPVLQTAQQFLGSQTPVLMDIATAANFPCQRPFSEHLGVAELPQYRILPNFKQVVVSSNQWQAAQDGGPFLFIQALLRTSTVPTYLRDDWYRDWGSIERYDRVVPEQDAPAAVVDQGSKRVFGWSRPRSDQGAPVTAPAMKDVRVTRVGGDRRRLHRLPALGAHPAAAGGADDGDAELAASRPADQRHRAADHETPVSMTATVPCEVIRDMPPAGGLVLGTAPADGKDAALNALFVNVNRTRVDITDRNVVVASVPRARVASPDCQRIEITSTEAGTFATFVGLRPGPGRQRNCAAGSPIRTCGRRSSACSPT